MEKTLNHAQNDPIHHNIRLFILCFEKQKFGVQKGNSLDSLNKISLSNTPSMQKRV